MQAIQGDLVRIKEEEHGALKDAGVAHSIVEDSTGRSGSGRQQAALEEAKEAQRPLEVAEPATAAAAAPTTGPGSGRRGRSPEDPTAVERDARGRDVLRQRGVCAAREHRSAIRDVSAGCDHQKWRRATVLKVHPRWGRAAVSEHSQARGGAEQQLTRRVHARFAVLEAAQAGAQAARPLSYRRHRSTALSLGSARLTLGGVLVAQRSIFFLPPPAWLGPKSARGCSCSGMATGSASTPSVTSPCRPA